MKIASGVQAYRALVLARIKNETTFSRSHRVALYRVMTEEMQKILDNDEVEVDEHAVASYE